MIRDTENNEFLKLLYDLYDHIKFPENQNKTTIKHKGIFGLFAYTEEIDEELESIRKKIIQYSSSLTEAPPNFDRMWDFCEFIRVIEKVFFYNNSPENFIYVESDIAKGGSGTRKFCLKDKNNEIRFTLDKKVLDMDIISVTVIRDYGLKMENTYKIVGDDMPYNDSSDLYLINEINFKLMDCMKSIFDSIVQKIDPPVVRSEDWDE